ncbi:MAG: D-alanyl-D-alanine carboxypeptidase family protein [Clostridia bacterium]
MGAWWAWLLVTLAASGIGSPPALTCRCSAAIVMRVGTGQVLGGVHAYRQRDPASLTKIMTAYVVIRDGRLDRTATVSRRAARTEGSKLHIRAGERYTLLDLLRGLLLRSGNDAAVALAEAESGRVSSFVAIMNRTARELGAYNTHFANPNGLTAPGHYSSAYDLALITRAALHLALFQHLVSTREDVVHELVSGRARHIITTNRLLEVFPGADGVKTGTTNAAGHCLIATATRHGVQLLAVILDSRNRWDDAADVLNWGFQEFKPVTAVHKGAVLGQVRVVRGCRRSVALTPRDSLSVMVPRAQAWSVVVTTAGAVAAPVRRGTVLGTAYVVAGSRVLGGEPLVAERSVGRRVLPLLSFRAQPR